MKIHQRSHATDNVSDDANNKETKYDVQENSLTKEYKLLSKRNDINIYNMLVARKQVLRTSNYGRLDNQIKQICTCVDNTRITSNTGVAQDAMLHKDNRNRIMIFLPGVKISLRDQVVLNRNSYTLLRKRSKDCLLAVTQQLPDDSPSKQTHKCHISAASDFSRLLILHEFTYNTIKYFLHIVKSTKQAFPEESSYTLLIDVENILQYLNCSNYSNKRITCKNYRHLASQSLNYENRICYPNTYPVCSHVPKNTSIINISVEHQCMKFDISICKYYSFTSHCFKALAAIYISQATDETNRVPSLYIRNWHIHNIGLGYLLGNLLKKFNVNTLNAMRNLYFIIITSNTPNLNIEINFKLKNCIFMMYDMDLFYLPIETFTIDRSMIEKTCSLDIISFNKIVSQKFTKEDKAKIKKTLKSETLLEEENNDDKMENMSYFNSESLISLQTQYSEVCTELTRDRSNETFTPSNDWLSRLDKVIRAHKVRVDTVLKNNSEGNYHINLPFWQTGVWLSKLFQRSKEIKASFNLPFINFDYINETVFERFSACEYAQAACDHWDQFSSKALCKVFLKYLSQSLVHIFLVLRFK